MKKQKPKNKISIRFVVCIGIVILNLSTFQVYAQDDHKTIPDYLELRLIDLSEDPIEQPGYKLITYQMMLQNTSDSDWIILGSSGFGSSVYGHVLTTAEDFKYNSNDSFHEAYRKCEIDNYSCEDGVKNVSQFFGTFVPSFEVIPPGTQTPFPREVWKISEFSTKPSLKLVLDIVEPEEERTSDGGTSILKYVKEYDAKISLTESNDIQAYPVTPFVGNLSWDEYYDRYSKKFNLLKIGDSREFEFGTMKFVGFHYDSDEQDYGDKGWYVDFAITNGSKGYGIDFGWEPGNGIWFDESAGFSGYIELERGGYNYQIGPGQTEIISWKLEQKVIKNSNNFEMPFTEENPNDATQLICAVFPWLNWDRPDIKQTRLETPTMLMACGKP